MSDASEQVSFTVTRDELEALLRRIVREEVTRLLAERRTTLLDDWGQEGPDEPQGDAALLAEVLTEIEHEQAAPQPHIDWAAARAELARAEAAGELPD